MFKLALPTASGFEASSAAFEAMYGLLFLGL